MRCGRRFGKLVLLARLGCGHLTEGHPAGRRRDRHPAAAATPDPDCDEHEAEASEERQQRPPLPPSRIAVFRRRSDHRFERGTGALDSGLRRPRWTRVRDRRRGAHRRARPGRPRPARRSCRSCGRDAHSSGLRGRRVRQDSIGDRAPRRALTRRSPRTTRRATGLCSRRCRAQWHGCRRCRLRRRLRRPGLRLPRGPRREQRERIQVAVRIGRQADTEMDIWLSPLGLAARPDGAHDIALFNRRSGAHTDRAEVDERDGVAVGGANRQTEPLVRQLARERDDAQSRRPDVAGHRRRHVDPTVLAAGIRVVLCDERAQHGAVHGPGPARRRWAQDEREQETSNQCGDSVAQFDNHASTIAARSAVVKSGYRDPL